MSMQAPPRRTLAFTLLEVVLAMAIFLIGFVAVAAIFPTAALLQKKATQDVLAQQVGRGGQAAYEAAGVTDADLGWTATPTYPADNRVHPVLGFAPAAVKLHLADRSYPTTESSLADRQMFWVPMIRRNVAADGWQVYFVVMARNEGETWDRTAGTWANHSTDPDYVPGLQRLDATVPDSSTFKASHGNLIRVGDIILDSNGNSHNVVGLPDSGTITVPGPIAPLAETGEQPNAIWIGRASAAGRSGTVRAVQTSFFRSPLPLFPPYNAVIDHGTYAFPSSPSPGTFSQTGFSAFTGQGYKNNVYARAATPGVTTNIARWSFTGLEPGATYRVLVTYSPYSNRATNAPYTIRDGLGGTALGTVLVNQNNGKASIAPPPPAPGNDYDGVPWDNIGDFTISGADLVVELTSDANNYVIADGVRIQRVN